MGWDHGLNCLDCKIVLMNVGRNCKLNRDSTSLDQLEKFFYDHGDHNLVYDADDTWVRMPGEKEYI